MPFVKKLRIKQPGLLVLMPITVQRFDIQSIDFISGLPSQGCNTIYTCIDRFTKFIQLIPCFKAEGALNLSDYPNSFFFFTSLGCLVYQKWYCITMIQGSFLTLGRPYGNCQELKFFLQAPFIDRQMVRLKRHIVPLSRL